MMNGPDEKYREVSIYIYIRHMKMMSVCDIVLGGLYEMLVLVYLQFLTKTSCLLAEQIVGRYKLKTNCDDTLGVMMGCMGVCVSGARFVVASNTFVYYAPIRLETQHSSAYR